MKLFSKGICRGFGAVYLPFKANGDKLIPLAVETECGNSIPYSSFWNSEYGTIVFVLPLLQCEKIVFLFADNKNPRFEISNSIIKWQSRFNYKFNSAIAKQFRDIENDTYFGQIHVRCDVAVEVASDEAIILKGVVCFPSDFNVDDIYLIDGKASKLNDFDIWLGRPTPVDYCGFSRIERSFSIRLPKDGKTYCLVAADSEKNAEGFLNFDPAALSYMLEVNSPLFYKASSPAAYHDFFRMRSRLINAAELVSNSEINQDSLFSIVVPLYKTPVSYFRDMINSVVSQVYQNWELILVNASPECMELQKELGGLADSRIKVITLEENKGIAENTNAGIAAVVGDYVVFFDHDDTLDPFALYRYAERIQDRPDTDALYCDEDFLNEADEYVSPHFKSDFNLDLLRVHNYITHLLCVRASFAKELMLRKEFDGAQDYDFLLRLVERTQSIYHVREVLYHWRISDTSTAKSAGNKNYADEAGRKALQEHLDRCGLNGAAELTDSACFYHISYALNEEALVSIVIPNKDSVEVLRRCIDSIEEKTDYRNFEILVIENNSTEDATFEYYRTVSEQYENVRIATWNGPFNYSSINNYGVGLTSGKYLLFLNNDTEVIEGGWLSSMLSFCQREDVGAVGAKLLYPDDTVQHAGVMMICCNNEGEMGGPIHVFNNLDRNDPGYMRRAVISQDLSAVTAACMMTKRSVFEELNGFNEDFEVAFNDVDFCLRVRSLDKLVVFDADALLYHYESFSRGYETGEKKVRFMREQGKLRTAWAEYYVNGDPYHSPMSTR